MPLEFRCAGCQRLLRVAEAMAGRQARCPSCGQIQVIPAPSEAAPSSPPADSSVPNAAGETRPGPAMPPAGAAAAGFAGAAGYPGGPSAGGPQGFGQPSFPSGPAYPPTGPPPGTAPPDASPFGLPQSAFPPARQDFGPVNPYQTPSADTSPAPAQFMAGAGVILPSRLDIGRALSAAWTIYRARIGFCVLVFLLTGLINFGFAFALQGVQTLAMIRSPFAAFFIMLFGQLVGLAISSWLMAGMFRCFLKLTRGQDAAIGEVFSGGEHFPRIFGGLLLLGIGLFAVYMVAAIVIGVVFGVSLAVAGGRPNPAIIVLLICLGLVFLAALLWLAIRFTLFFLPIVDKNMGVFEGFSTAYRITEGNVLACLALGLLVFLLVIATVVPVVLIGHAAGVAGLAVAVPIAVAVYLFWASFMPVLTTVVYLHMSGQRTTVDVGDLPVGSFAPASQSTPGAFPPSAYPQGPSTPFSPPPGSPMQ